MPSFLISIIEWFAANPWATALLMVLFVAVSILMVLAILIQRPQGGGLAAAFGGSSAGSGQTALGTKTGDALTFFTISVFITFVVFGILLNYATTPPPPRDVTEVAAPATAPATTPATGTPAPADAAPNTAAPTETKPESQPQTQPATQPETKPAEQPAATPPAQPTPAPAPTETPKPADPAQPKN
ncbi:MAG TPA: preprotein translocase subunit SecG [Phycisphaerales bacterium]